jgi:hypothetical protein
MMVRDLLPAPPSLLPTFNMQLTIIELASNLRQLHVTLLLMHSNLVLVIALLQ